MLALHVQHQNGRTLVPLGHRIINKLDYFCVHVCSRRLIKRRNSEAEKTILTIFAILFPIISALEKPFYNHVYLLFGLFIDI